MIDQLRAVTGGQVMDPREVANLLELNPNGQQMGRFEEVPFSGSLLSTCGTQADHDLIPVFTLSIDELAIRFPHMFFARGEKAWWKKGETFAFTTGHAPRWHLIRRNPVALWPGMRWYSEGRIAVFGGLATSKVPGGQKLPSARVLVYAALLHFLLGKERWLRGFYAPSSCVAGNGRSVFVGYNDEGGVDVVEERDNWPCCATGLITEHETTEERVFRRGRGLVGV